jgi:large subunit ribosomal protein L13
MGIEAGIKTMRTFSAKPAEIKRDWVVLDATGVAVGRLAAEAAKILRGKHKPIFTPHIDTGDHVIIINAARAIYTGNNKGDEPIYRHTLYPGGIKSVPKGEFLEKRPEDAIMRTVKGMLPHNSLGAAMLIKGTPSPEWATKVAASATSHMRRNVAPAGE